MGEQADAAGRDPGRRQTGESREDGAIATRGGLAGIRLRRIDMCSRQDHAMIIAKIVA